MQIEMIKQKDLIPRKVAQNYTKELVKKRLNWLTGRTGVDFFHTNSYSIDPEQVKPNIENFIGVSQIPIGIAGPLKVNGEYARGVYYVPFATTEGALVESYERGMIVITKSGGANTLIHKDEINTTPVFLLNDVIEAREFAVWVENNFQKIKQEAENTTKHGKLLRIKPYIIGTNVLLNFYYFTGDAMGLNMINIATDKACQYILKETEAEKYYLRSNFSSDKKPSFFNFIEGYGKEVSADVTIPKAVIESYLHTTPQEMFNFWVSSVYGSLQAGIVGLNAHFANGLAAIYIACGQDVAQIVNASIGISGGHVTEEGDVYVFVRLPCLVIGTVGGGTGLPTQKECLRIMGCSGAGKAKKFSEIVAAALLAGEISICAALASGEFIQAHISARSRKK